jgi:hypothetical protein
MERQPKLSYINFQNLENFSQNQNYLKLMRDISTGIIENENFQTQLKYINELRRVRKFHQDLFSVTFNNILNDFIDNSMGSNDPELVYNSLILVTEIFSFYEFYDINNWIPDLLTKVIELSAQEKNQLILNQSFIALYFLANNMFYEETLLTLLRLVKNKSEVIAKNATETLLTFIYFIDYFTLINGFDWQEPFYIILELANSSLLSNVGNVKKIISYIYRKLNETEFVSFLQNNLNAENEKTIMGLLINEIEIEDKLKFRINNENIINNLEYII